MSTGVEVEDVLVAADESFRSRFVEREETETDYGDRIPMARNTDTGQVVSVRLSGVTRIGIFGQSGSTKTIGSKRLMGTAVSEMSSMDWKAFHLSDIKNDMRSFNGVQGPGTGASQSLQDFTEGLLDKEECVDLERVLAIPYFMVKHYKNYPSNQTVFAFTLNDLSKSEFKDLLGFHSWNPAPRETLLEIFQQEVDFDSANLNRIVSIAEEKYPNNTLSRKLSNIKGEGLINNRVDSNLRDVLMDFKQKKVFSLGLKHWRNYLGGDENYFQFYSGKALRELKSFMEEEDMRNVIVFADEFHKLAPQGERSIIKEEFQDLYDVSARQRNIPTAIASQRPSQIPNSQNDDDLDFVSELTDVFLMRGKKPLHRSEWKPILRDMGVYNGRGGKQLDKWEAKMQSLEETEGIYVNALEHDGPEDCPRVRFLSPPVPHPEEDN